MVNPETIFYLLNKIKSLEINSFSNYSDLVVDLESRMDTVDKTLISNMKLLLQKAIDNTPEEELNNPSMVEQIKIHNVFIDNFKIILSLSAAKFKQLNNKYSYDKHKILYDSFYNKLRYNLNNNKIHKIIDDVKLSMINNKLGQQSVFFSFYKILMSIFVEIDIDLAKFIILNKDIENLFEETVDEQLDRYNTDYDSIPTESVIEQQDDEASMTMFQKILSFEIVIPDDLAVKFITIMNYVLFIILYNSNNIDFVKIMVFVYMISLLDQHNGNDIELFTKIVRDYLLDKEPHSVFTLNDIISGMEEPVMNFMMALEGGEQTQPQTQSLTEGFSNVGKKWYMIILYIVLVIGALYGGYYYLNKF
jgi:hypothetical protein